MHIRMAVTHIGTALIILRLFLVLAVILISQPASAVHLAVREAFEDPRLISVTTKYGPSVIPMDSLKDGFEGEHSLTSEEVTVNGPTPFSAWWFPVSEKTLFDGSESPLGKYDRYRRAIYASLGKDPPLAAAEWEEEHTYKPGAAHYEGRCKPVGLFRMLCQKPCRDVCKAGKPVRSFRSRGFRYIEKIRFKIFDIAALAALIYDGIEDSELEFHGQKFTGMADGSVYQDMFPEQWFRWLEVQLFGKRQSFLMDHDPGEAVWMVPVYKGKYKIQAVADNPNAVEVTTWVSFADLPSKEEMYAFDTVKNNRTYHSLLVGHRSESDPNLLVIDEGKWLKKGLIDSVQNHPDFVVAVPNPQELVRKSRNPEIEIDLIDGLLRESYE